MTEGPEPLQPARTGEGGAGRPPARIGGYLRRAEPIVAALEPAAGAAAGRARALLARLDAHLGAATDRRSGLTPNGQPIEFAFVDGSAELRYACEFRPEELPADRRVVAAASFARDLGHPAPQEGWLAWIRAIQRGLPLAFGAYLGARHGPGPDRLKLYAEVPGGSFAQHRAFLDAAGGGWGMDPRWQLRMVGLEAVPERRELYFRLRAADLDLLRIHAGEAASQAREIFAEIADRGPGALRDLGALGCSIAFRDGRQDGITVYVRSDSLFASALATRKALLSWAARHGRDLGAYCVASRSALATSDKAVHGMIGVFVRRSEPPGLSIGLATWDDTGR